MPLPQLSVIRDCALARLEALPRAAPALALPEPPAHLVGSVGNGDVVPAHGLVGRMPGLASRAFAPRPVCGLLDVGTLAGALHAPSLPMGSLIIPGRGLWTAAVRFAHALGVTVCGLDESACALLAAAGAGMIICGHRYRSRTVTKPVASLL